MSTDNRKICIDKGKCVVCLSCVDMCDYNALRLVNEKIEWSTDLCTRCLVCPDVCPCDAISVR
ncbi:MAG: ferredoxin [Candidatus Schekmanbacteria bacterium]|nr:ferredoxin [Candidatus Schekmanbacteria bacterium]